MDTFACEMASYTSRLEIRTFFIPKVWKNIKGGQSFRYLVFIKWQVLITLSSLTLLEEPDACLALGGIVKRI